MAAHQLFAGRIIGAAMRLLYGVRYTDMCPFRAIRRDVLMRLGMREETYGWNLEMQMRAARAGLRIAEVPVAHRRRAGGVSKVSGNLCGTLKASWRILATFVRIAAEGRERGPKTVPAAAGCGGVPAIGGARAGRVGASWRPLCGARAKGASADPRPCRRGGGICDEPEPVFQCPRVHHKSGMDDGGLLAAGDHQQP